MRVLKNENLAEGRCTLPAEDYVGEEDIIGTVLFNILQTNGMSYSQHDSDMFNYHK